MSMTRKWSLVTVVLIASVFVASWFLLISPKRGEAADLRQQNTEQMQSNDQLVQKLNELKAQSADLPKQRALLELMQKQMPGNPALPTLIRDLTAAGKKAGVSINAMAPTTPVAVSPALVPAPAPATSTAPGATSSESGSTTPAPAAAAPSATLYQVSLKLQVTGSYFQLEQFINQLEGLRRSFLVTGFSLKPGGAATATSGTAAATTGDLALDLNGRVFLSLPVAAAATAATPIPAAAPATATAPQ